MVTRFSFIYRSSSIVLLALLAGAFLRFHKLGEVPPGLHYDFAANAIIANGIAFEGWREVFITAYTGKEVLFFYTAGLIFKLVGSSIFALQFTAALYGILGIAACYFAARQLLWDQADSKWIAALAAAILSFTFMHLIWSRYGERAVTEPFVQGLAVGFLFRGLRRSRASKPPYADFILAGAFTGLAAYTYLAARLFPIPIVVTLLALLISEAR
ncbi:MAG: glycosyltransferase family 39 protein, partial [Chloroflexota bacterium]